METFTTALFHVFFVPVKRTIYFINVCLCVVGNPTAPSGYLPFTREAMFRAEKRLRIRQFDRKMGPGVLLAGLTQRVKASVWRYFQSSGSLSPS